MKIRSREYKVMLDHRALGERRSGRDGLWDDVRELARSLRDVDADGDLDDDKSRRIIFLDTPDLTLRRSGLILRRRSDDDGSDAQYTLKARSLDRFVAAGAALDPGPDLEASRKLEEDIGPGLRCQLSHSSSIEPSRDSGLRPPPDRLADAARLYPVLADLRVDDRPCPGDTRLDPVNRFEAFERVHTGARLQFGDGSDRRNASVAVITWASGEHGRPVVAELSFRLRAEDRDAALELTPAVATVVDRFFDLVTRLDWCRPDGTTKTAFAYRDQPAR